MSIKALQDYTFTAKYSRWLPSKNRRETWSESVDRVKNMMEKKYSSYNIQNEIDFSYDFMLKKKVLGSQRILQFGGDPVFQHHARVYNCSGSYVDRLEFFQQCMYLLLCGSGVGFSVQKHHINKLPNLISSNKSYSKGFVIEDTIEGWSDAIGVLVSSYFDHDGQFKEYIGRNIDFDFSKIRKAGSSLSSGIGKAPGYKPLKNALSKIQEILDSAIGNQKIRPIQAYDIVMHSSDAVLSGGVRRSATIAVFSPEDREMMQSKIGDWKSNNPQRGRSNNSVILLRDQISREEFQNIIKFSKEWGEPGFYLTNDLESMCNPCLEIGFYCYDSNGRSGIQMCNLSTINVGKVKTEEDFYEACRAAAIIGTLQAGFNEFPYLGEVTENIVRREALLGVSMTGMMDAPDIVLNPSIQQKGAIIVKETNKILATKIGINQAARTTCCKPEGTTSCLLGTSSGIHPHHAKRYIRRVQANKSEEVYKYFKSINPIACEESVWSVNKTDDVISFCIEVADGSKIKNQISGLKLLEYVKLTQQNWVNYGKNPELCTQPWIEHNVSNTVNVKENEWDEVTNFIYDNREYFCGVSLLSSYGDKDYSQCPFTSIYLPSEISREYGDGSLLVSGLIETALELFDDDLWFAGDILLYNKEIKGKAKNAWKEKCLRFADKYMQGNIKKLVYCMKDVYNWKIWLDLNREYKQVDYTKMYETEDNTIGIEEIACAGGKCEL